MGTPGIEQTIERIAEAYEIELHDVRESGDTLVIEQDAFDETRFAMTSALLFDRYDADFEHIELRLLDADETKHFSRQEFLESFHRLSSVVGN